MIATIGIVVSGLSINSHSPFVKITSGFERTTSRANSTVGRSTEYRSTTLQFVGLCQLETWIIGTSAAREAGKPTFRIDTCVVRVNTIA
jgi:hypothetical protein